MCHYVQNVGGPTFAGELITIDIICITGLTEY